MSKEFLNTLSMQEIARRLHNGEKIFNDTDTDAFAKYVGGIGLCKFQKKTGELLVMNLTLTLFSHLYFEDLNEDYESMIGCVGWFHSEKEFDKKYATIGMLKNYDSTHVHPFVDNLCEYHWQYFTPAKKSELKFWED